MLVKPDIWTTGVMALDLDKLWAQGIRGFIFDLDNTLMAPRAGVLTDAMAAWLDKTTQIGFQSMVVSNNPRDWYIQAVSQVLHCPIIGNAGKPRIRNLKRALDILKLDAPQVAIVGDRPLTDIWGGQKLGMMTILIDPLIKHHEPWYFKVLREVEYLFVHNGHQLRPASPKG
jgi:HAD superfamily phosphatase (TIGR01668 family)